MVLAQENIEWQQPVDEKSIPSRRPVKRRRNRTPWKGVLILILILGIAGVLTAETINLTVVKGAEIRGIQKEIEALKVENNLLQAEVDKLRSVSRIEREAIAMGMVKPAGTVYVAGTLPVAENQTGAEPSPTPSATMEVAEESSSRLKEISQKLTSFFASTQR